MRPDSKDLDRILDDAIAGIREETIDEQAMEDAAARVWQRVEREGAEAAARRREVDEEPREHDGSHPILDCNGYQALIPAYLTDSLNDARRLLLDDHLRECVPCRKALKQARAAAAGKVAPARVTARGARPREWGWAVAAAALVVVALVGLRFDIPGVVTFETGGVVTVKQTDGQVFRVNQAGTFPLPVGQPVRLEGDDDRLRTAKGTRAVLELSDGSLVEMNERSQLSVSERHSRLGGARKSSTIELDRGSVIVEAADQKDARLYVETDDCTVEVKGTVFSVNKGMKGSRVSVIEGEVLVDLMGGSDRLLPGDQTVTSPAVTRIPVADEIAWSQNLDRHLKLLKELTELGRELDRSVQAPELRFSTRLLDRCPANTVVYGAIPNLGGTLSDAYSQLRAKVDSNPVLREWWQSSVVAAGADRQLDEAIARLRDFGEQFGNEIVITLQAGPDGSIQEPLIMAELARPAEFRDFLIRQLADLHAETGESPDMAILEGPALASHGDLAGRDFYIWINDGFFAASPALDRIRALAPLAAAATPATSFDGGAFHQRLAQQYHDGVQWILGVDLASVMGLERGGEAGREQALLERLGLFDLQHLIVERRDVGGKSDTRAELTFSQDRRGVTAWLAEPAPMGSLEFISPEAAVAAAFVMKDPASVIDELMSYVGGAEVEDALTEFENEVGVDLRDDFAATLGGEFALALDGPVIPEPSWKFVIEVYDPVRLQRSLEWAVERVDALLREQGRKGLRLQTVESRGLRFHAIESLDTGIAVHYVTVDGYLLAGPSRALLERALDGRASGHTLPRSHRFTALLPQDSQVNFSAIGYQNLGGMIGPMLQHLRGVAGQLGPEQLGLLETISGNTGATLAFAYGEADRITVAASSQGGLFSSGLSLFSLPGLLQFEDLIGEAAERGAGS